MSNRKACLYVCIVITLNSCTQNQFVLITGGNEKNFEDNYKTSTINVTNAKEGLLKSFNSELKHKH